MCTNGSLTRQEYVLRDGMAFIAKTDHKRRIAPNNFDSFQTRSCGASESIGQADAMRKSDMPSAKATERITRTSEVGSAHADHTPSPAVRCRPLADSLGADATRLPA